MVFGMMGITRNDHMGPHGPWGIVGSKHLKIPWESRVHSAGPIMKFLWWYSPLPCIFSNVVKTILNHPES